MQTDGQTDSKHRQTGDRKRDNTNNSQTDKKKIDKYMYDAIKIRQKNCQTKGCKNFNTTLVVYKL